MLKLCSGLEDQLLGIVVAEERPDLEDAKNQLIVSNARMKQELKEIEDKILVRLSSSEGSPVDDIDLIQTLEASKIKSQEIKVCFLLLVLMRSFINVSIISGLHRFHFYLICNKYLIKMTIYIYIYIYIYILKRRSFCYLRLK